MADIVRLLVVVDDEDDWPDALGLPFRDATVVVGDRLSVLAETFDAVAIAHRDFDPARLDRLVPELCSRLRPDGTILVSVGDSGSEDVEPPVLQGLSWHGMTLLDGRTYAVLRMTNADDAPVATGALLVAAHSAARLAVNSASRDRLTTRDVRQLMAVGEEDRRRSEHALLAELAKVVAHSDRLAAQRRKPAKPAAAAPVTVKALLRTSPSGRRLLRVFGRVKRRFRGLVSATPPGKSPS